MAEIALIAMMGMSGCAVVSGGGAFYLKNKEDEEKTTSVPTKSLVDDLLNSSPGSTQSGTQNAPSGTTTETPSGTTTETPSGTSTGTPSGTSSSNLSTLKIKVQFKTEASKFLQNKVYDGYKTNINRNYKEKDILVDDLVQLLIYHKFNPNITSRIIEVKFDTHTEYINKVKEINLKNDLTYNVNFAINSDKYEPNAYMIYDVAMKNENVESNVYCINMDDEGKLELKVCTDNSTKWVAHNNFIKKKLPPYPLRDFSKGYVPNGKKCTNRNDTYEYMFGCGYSDNLVNWNIQTKKVTKEGHPVFKSHSTNICNNGNIYIKYRKESNTEWSSVNAQPVKRFQNNTFLPAAPNMSNQKYGIKLDTICFSADQVKDKNENLKTSFMHSLDILTEDKLLLLMTTEGYLSIIHLKKNNNKYEIQDPSENGLQTYTDTQKLIDRVTNKGIAQLFAEGPKLGGGIVNGTPPDNCDKDPDPKKDMKSDMNSVYKKQTGCHHRYVDGDTRVIHNNGHEFNRFDIDINDKLVKEIGITFPGKFTSPSARHDKNLSNGPFRGVAIKQRTPTYNRENESTRILGFSVFNDKWERVGNWEEWSGNKDETLSDSLDILDQGGRAPRYALHIDKKHRDGYPEGTLTRVSRIHYGVWKNTHIQALAIAGMLYNLHMIDMVHYSNNGDYLVCVGNNGLLYISSININNGKFSNEFKPRIVQNSEGKRLMALSVFVIGNEIYVVTDSQISPSPHANHVHFLNDWTSNDKPTMISKLRWNANFTEIKSDEVKKFNNQPKYVADVCGYPSQTNCTDSIILNRDLKTMYKFVNERWDVSSTDTGIGENQVSDTAIVVNDDNSKTMYCIDKDGKKIHQVQDYDSNGTLKTYNFPQSNSNVYTCMCVINAHSTKAPAVS